MAFLLCLAFGGCGGIGIALLTP
ncbi:hypothetical protein FC063_20765 [Vibrio tasmaniensis]|uniref:Sulfite exporter TauE/SafE family protein n=1 Tax=Vibrio tasmaniensis TaxID=212663 RepID=A0AB38NQ88_9VIBR|nr:MULTISPECIES: hypothetical protein [Vibrio]TKG31521.1 hypothetical protein FC057_14390 [Vibrio tasmaniensis]TKG38464.1 hypothetical protein FC063_20765 [Vibrio tasmaniensis]TKG48057.1 hypothetical protein FC060_11020 [Vibrio tasmaniensis]TKG50228.1 hypothetical protein FC070_14590 [Vibrio tasmaniensis]TKG51293.1 hypothetical protein FC061_11375 [Vibrio tasmaniensis]